MTWTVDIERHRTLDPATGLELRFRSVTPLGVCEIEIFGEAVDLRFKASSVVGSFSKSELAAVGAGKTGLWVIFAGNELPPETQRIVSEAMTATRFEHGHPRDDRRFFLRFGRRGEIYGLGQLTTHQSNGNT